MSRFRTHLARSLAVAAVVLASLYAGVVAYAYLQQDRLLYGADAAPAGAEAPWPGVQVVQIATADGERLVGWYREPEPGRPLILFLDGRGGGVEEQKWRWKRLAEAGVGGLVVAYRGFSGSTGRPSEEGLAEDARAAYDWLAGRSPDGRVVVHGLSLGSGVAARLATERSPEALVLEAPFASVREAAAARAPYLPVRQLMTAEFPTARHVARVRCPVLVVHGDGDTVIGFDQARRVYAAAGAPKALVRMRGSDHLTLVRDGVYDHVWRFLGVPFDGSTAFKGRPAPFTRVGTTAAGAQPLNARDA